MNPRQHLHDIHRNIVPTNDELAAVQARIDQVVPLIGNVAEVRPAGSWAKHTMLRGRKEADLVVILSQAPEADTLEAIAQRLAPMTGLRKKPGTSFKAVQLEFADGVSIDLLLVAKSGRTFLRTLASRWLNHEAPRRPREPGERPCRNRLQPRRPRQHGTAHGGDTNLPTRPGSVIR